MPDYRFLLVNASDGSNFGELPLTLAGPFSLELNGCGQLSGTVPLDHPMCVYTKLQGDREITVLRDNVAVWNGPIMNLDAQWSPGGDRTVTVTAAEPTAYLSKRVLEIDKSYTAADLFDIARDLVTYATSKESNGDVSGGTSINAALPRFFVSPASGTLAGTTKTLSFAGSARYVILDLINDLVTDPSTGLDYRMDYASGSTRQQCDRTFTMGSPSLGSTLSINVDEHIVVGFGKGQDRGRAANRVHVLGNGYTSTQQNTGSITAGDILLESVFSPSTNLTDHTQIDNYAKDARRFSQPPVATYTWTVVPGQGPIGWGDINLGDAVNLNIGGTTVLHSLGHVRVVKVEVQPPLDGGPELVTYTANVPLDQLGT